MLFPFLRRSPMRIRNKANPFFEIQSHVRVMIKQWRWLSVCKTKKGEKQSSGCRAAVTRRARAWPSIVPPFFFFALKRPSRRRSSSDAKTRGLTSFYIHGYTPIIFRENLKVFVKLFFTFPRENCKICCANPCQKIWYSSTSFDSEWKNSAGRKTNKVPSTM